MIRFLLRRFALRAEVVFWSKWLRDDVARPGGSVLLVHFVDEGKKQDYTGLHGWNLREENGVLIIANEHEHIDARAHFTERAAVTARTKGDLVFAELRVGVTS